jgi:hypothetical protein
MERPADEYGFGLRFCPWFLPLVPALGSCIDVLGGWLRTVAEFPQVEVAISNFACFGEVGASVDGSMSPRKA